MANTLALPLALSFKSSQHPPSFHINARQLPDLPLYEWNFKEKYESTTNVLGLVTFSIVFGVAIGTLRDTAKPLLTFFHALSEVMMVITGWVIWLSPLGVFFLVMAKVVAIESFSDLVGKLGLYFATVLLGLVLHGFGTLTVMYFVCTKTLPFRVVARLSAVMLTAFGTASRWVGLLGRLLLSSSL